MFRRCWENWIHTERPTNQPTNQTKYHNIFQSLPITINAIDKIIVCLLTFNLVVGTIFSHTSVSSKRKKKNFICRSTKCSHSHCAMCTFWGLEGIIQLNLSICLVNECWLLVCSIFIARCTCENNKRKCSLWQGLDIDISNKITLFIGFWFKCRAHRYQNVPSKNIQYTQAYKCEGKSNSKRCQRHNKWLVNGNIHSRWKQISENV